MRERLEPEPEEKISRWNLQKARWEHFKRLCHVNLNPKVNRNQEDQYLLQIFNIWHNGNIPNSWKQVTIIPVPKSAKDTTNPMNYQPIALTSCICKTLEWMINNRLTWFLVKNKLITNLQTGLRKARSTIDYLIHLETFIRETFAKIEHMTAIFSFI